MSCQDNESKTINYNILGGQLGHGNGGMGGSRGTGEGPTVIFDNSMNKMYVGEVTPVPFPKSLLNNNSVHQGQGLILILYKWLESPPDTKGRQYELQSLRHEATGHWLLRNGQFIRWKDTPGSLWIRGISGTGKSVLSSTIIEAIVKACPNQSAVAYFYFDFRNERQRIGIMLCSIIWQLSGRSPSPYSALNRLYKTLGNGTIPPQLIHLQEVLEDLLSELDQTYIIIDGLDECNKTDWKHLMEFIHNLCHPAKNALHLLFTSQPLEEFKTVFKDVTFIELGSAVSNNDIRSFIGSEVPRVGNWASHGEYTKDVTEQIVYKSNGMFRMAACLLIELKNCYEDEWHKTLTGLPSDLSGIYSRFLTRAKASLEPAVIQAIFRWLVFSARQVTSDELADAISFPLDARGFDFSDPAKSTYYPKRRQDNSNKLKLLEGLIVIKNNGSNEQSIAFAHLSVRDYIHSPEFQQEFGTIIDLTKNVSHKFITQTCVCYLLLFADTEHLMTKDTVPNYPISLYAAEYWFHHLRLCDDRDQEALLPSTLHLLEDGSSQHAISWYENCFLDGPISPAVCMWSEMSYTEEVRCLLMKHNTSVDLATEDGRTVLHLTLEKSHLNIGRLLIEHNASVDQATKDGWTALHFASEKGDLNVAQLLIKCNVSVDQASKNGWTALHFASRRGHLNVVQLLIEHNASIDKATKDGRTALDFAFEWNHLDIVRLLTEHNTSIEGTVGLHPKIDAQLPIQQLDSQDETVALVSQFEPKIIPSSILALIDKPLILALIDNMRDKIEDKIQSEVD